MWPDLYNKENHAAANFRQPGGASGWHSDLVHEAQPAGVTHLHNDTVPELGGDTVWSSGELCLARPIIVLKNAADHCPKQVILHMISSHPLFVASWMEKQPFTGLRMLMSTAKIQLLVPNSWSASIRLFECILQQAGRACG